MVFENARTVFFICILPSRRHVINHVKIGFLDLHFDAHVTFNVFMCFHLVFAFHHMPEIVSKTFLKEEIKLPFQYIKVKVVVFNYLSIDESLKDDK